MSNVQKILSKFSILYFMISLAISTLIVVFVYKKGVGDVVGMIPLAIICGFFPAIGPDKEKK